MLKKSALLLVALILVIPATTLQAWDHPGHMTSAAIAFAEIESSRPELIEKIGGILLSHPDIAPFWVASGGERGLERTRRMFIEGARWPDDAKWTMHDRPNYHSARWPLIEEGAPPEAVAAAEARGGKPRGQAIEALVLNFAVLANPETSKTDRARALTWVLHIMGDIHQPMHVTDLFSATYPNGNSAATLSYVDDPLTDGTIPLHLLWDSNNLRTTDLEDVDRNAKELRAKYPRSSFPELGPVTGPEVFEQWARESYRVAVEFAYGSRIETVINPNEDVSPDDLVKSMALFILEGISPVEEAPAVPEEHWAELQETAHRRITLAGYRLADLILSAADNIATEVGYAPVHNSY